MENLRCFISYSWDTVSHCAWVREFAACLRENGIDALLDQFLCKPGTDLLKFMENSIRESNFVLLVCTPQFAKKANSGAGGVGYEKIIVTGELFAEQSIETKYIPLLREGSPNESLPSYLKSKVFIDFRDDTKFQEKLEDLLRHFYDEPLYPPPKLGLKPQFKKAQSKKYINVTNNTFGTFESNQVEKLLSTGKVIIKASERLRKILQFYPEIHRMIFSEMAIDGVFEISNCQNDIRQFAGFLKEQIKCYIDDKDEWPPPSDTFYRNNLIEKLNFCIIGDSNVAGWINPGHIIKQNVFPGRLRRLMKPPISSVTDRKELILSIGNSDYFNVRTITEMFKRNYLSAKSDLEAIHNIFPSFWTNGEQFSNDAIPYHLSAQGIITCRDKNNDLYLITTLSNPSQNPLVPGWNVTMTEQMRGPGVDNNNKNQPHALWWKTPLKNINFSKDLEGDKHDNHIFDTLSRGVEEEFGYKICDEKGNVLPNIDLKLLNVCIEQDMFFCTFIFYLELPCTPQELYSKWKHIAVDGAGKEMIAFASIKLEGKDDKNNAINPCKTIAYLLKLDKFNGKNFVMSPQKFSLETVWHISSKMRLYALARYKWKEEILNYIEIGENFKYET